MPLEHKLKLPKFPKILKILKLKKTRSVEMSTSQLKISNTVSESDLEKKFAGLKVSSDLEDEKQKLETTNVKDFAVRLGLDEFTKNKEEWEKFYNFAGSEFVWPQPPTDINERRLIFDYVVDPDWDPIGEELAKNALEYRRLLESNTLDSSQGTHILIVNGSFVRYGSSEEAKEMEEKHPGCYYAPIKEQIIKLRRFSAIDDDRGWQVHVRIRNKDDPLDVATMTDEEEGYRMILDTGATVTVIPYFLKKRLRANDGWSKTPGRSSGYGSSTKMFRADKEWEISIGDGTNWSCWVDTDEICHWQKNPKNIDCGLIGYDVINNIPHYKSCRQPYVFLQNDVFDQIQQLRTAT